MSATKKKTAFNLNFKAQSLAIRAALVALLLSPLLSLAPKAAGPDFSGPTEAPAADLVYTNETVGDTSFSHERHLAREETCSACHPSPFAAEKTDGRNWTMVAMYAGEGCGSCHRRGQVAFDAHECGNCHGRVSATGDSPRR